MNTQEHNEIVVYMLLHDGTTVKQTFYDMIFQAIDEVIPVLISGVPYTAEILCGEEFWKRLKNGRTLAGKCVAHMVLTGKLPLKLHGCSHKVPLEYTI